MKHIVTLLACLVCLGWFAATAAADSIKITFANQGKGQTIAVEGTYTVADGYTLCGVTVQARPLSTEGGEGGQNSAEASGGDFSTIVAVPVGEYTVQAILAVKDSKGQVTYYFSDEVSSVLVDG